MNYEAVAALAVERHGAMQKPRELADLLEFLDLARSPRSVLEIGGMHGGTAWAWYQFSPRPSIVTVDLFVLEGRMDLADVPVYLVVGDSHARETLAMARAALDGDQVDFLFIDGDHSYEGVRRDFEMYAPLVRPGGIIALHDVSVEQPARSRPIHDVVPFWNQVRKIYDNAYEIFDADGELWGGIGVVLTPGGERAAANRVASVRALPNPTADERVATVPYDEPCEACGEQLSSGESVLCASCASFPRPR